MSLSCCIYWSAGGYQSARCAHARFYRFQAIFQKIYLAGVCPMRILKLAAVLAVGSLMPAAAFAAPITVTNNSSAGWVQIGSSTTFGLPANLISIGCGSEN